MKFIPFFLVACVGLQQTVPSTGFTFDKDEVAKTIEASLKCHNNPGLAVAVVRKGKVIFSQGFGVKNVESRDPVDADTLFGVASVSKSFAATLLVKLLHENTSLTADSKVSELLGDAFQMPDKLRTTQATFADLMAHRMAIPGHNRLRFNLNLTLENVFKYTKNLEIPDKYQFRVDYIYNNIMFGVVSRIAEIIGGSSWDDLVQKNLFEPLGMSKSTLSPRVDFTKKDIATPYIEAGTSTDKLKPVDPDFPRKWAQMSGSGSVISTANDMTKWMNFHLSLGKSSQGQIMPSTLVKQIQTPHFVTDSLASHELRKPKFPESLTSTSYGFGLRLGMYRGYDRIWHSGSTAGYRAYMSMLPGPQIGVVTLMNGEDSSYIHRLPLQLYLTDKALGVKPWLDASTICSYPKPWSKRPKSSSAPKRKSSGLSLSKDEYEGTYHHHGYGNVMFKFNDSTDSLELEYGWGKWPIYPIFSRSCKNNMFYGAPDSSSAFSVRSMCFLTDTQNTSTIIGVEIRGFDSRAPPRFCKEDKEEQCTAEGIIKTEEHKVCKCCEQVGASKNESSNSTCTSIGVNFFLLLFCFLVYSKEGLLYEV